MRVTMAIFKNLCFERFFVCRHIISHQLAARDYTLFFYKKPFYKKPRLKTSKIAEKNKKLFRSIMNYLRNLFVVSWHTLRNLTYFCSVFLIFLTYKKSIRNFFDQKLAKREETF